MLENVAFRGRSVLKYAGMAEIFVPYNQGQPRPTKTHGLSLQEHMMKAAGDLAGSIGELVTEGTVGRGDAGVDRGAGRARVLSGLKSDVIQ